ncbi:YhgE/Pip domain-containing protein, partial [Bacillus sp. JJ864]|uniref:YhgE/Pip domain-containing protein n=1 Tax=Bacillus sp. JJ864 TaxID=3122975 RepID=UPI002FFD9BE2
MRGWKLLGKEFATIIKSKKILIPIIAVLFIPVLYAGMFLWAFWDPYKQLDDLPVAVVNLDEGVVYNGKPIEAGKELVKNLKEKDGFKWEFVSEETAKKGMDDRKYYMTVRIPSDFSKNTTTLLDANPKKSKLEYIPNESLNFLSSQIGGSAIEKIKGEVSASVTKTYAETMFDSLKDVSKGFADASDGAGQLHDGSGKITNGLGELSGKANDGLNKLATGSGELTGGLGQLIDSKGKFQNGMGQLATGSNQITNGLGELNSKVSGMPGGMNQLLGGSQQITNGLGELNSKVNAMPGGVNQLLDGSKQITGGLNELINPKGELQSSLGQLLSGSQEITNGLKEVQKGTQDISSGASGLSQGVSEWKKKAEGLNGFASKTAGDAKAVTANLGDLNEKIKALPEEYRKQLEPAIQEAMANSQKVSQETVGVAQGVQGLAGENGAGKIEAGATKLANGADRLDKGISPLADGSRKITGGLGQLVDSKGKFQTGLNQLAAGSGKITGGLNELASNAGPLAN